jgi:hypothetical protein
LGTQLKWIIALQKIDTETNKINIRKKMLPAEMAKLDETYQVYFADFEMQKKALEELNKSHKEREEKLKKGLENLKKAKDRLSEVKTNKEYQAMLKEIEAAELKNSAVEDEILVVMDKLEQARKVSRLREKDLEQYRKDYEAKRRLIEEELKDIDAQISVLLEKSSVMRGEISPGLLKRYETIKTRSHGLAVISAWKEICTGCHMNIPPQLYIELQKSDDIQYCPHCNRIIYWEDQN